MEKKSYKNYKGIESWRGSGKGSLSQEQVYKEILKELLLYDEIHIESLNSLLLKYTPKMRGLNFSNLLIRAKYYNFLIKRMAYAGIIKIKDPQIFGRFILNKEKIEEYLKWKNDEK